MPPTTKLHRWLDLIVYLVGRRYPVTIDEIMAGVPAYAAGQDDADDQKALASVRRMFERDKADLRAAGIAIETIRWGEDADNETVGYRLDGGDFYLPYLRLLGNAEPAPALRGRPLGRGGNGVFEIQVQEARAALEGLTYLMRIPGSPLARDARFAYRKLTFDVDPNRFGAAPLTILSEASPSLSLNMRRLSEALLRHKRVTFLYRGINREEPTHRDVAPYGLLYQSARWYLIGHDALRDDVRVFRVSRMESVEVNAARPQTPDFEVPSDFDLNTYAGRRPWELGDGDGRPSPVRVLFRFPTSIWIERNQLGTPVEEWSDGSSVRTFEVSDPEAFVRWILGFRGEAEIQLPGELRREARRAAERVARNHEQAPRA
jgi:proteasome accessory factor B